VLYCDICIVSLKYFFTYGTLNLTFYTTLRYNVFGCSNAVVGEPAAKDSQMSVDLVVGGNENVSNTVVVETTQMQSLTAPTRYCVQLYVKCIPHTVLEI